MSTPIDPSALGTPIDPAVPSDAELLAQGEVLAQRVEALRVLLATKAEKAEMRSTRRISIGSLVLNIAHVLMFAVALIFGVGYVGAQHQISALAICTGKQAAVQQSNTTILRDAAAKERAALRTLVDVLASTTASRDARQTAFLSYQTGLHAADVQRTTIAPVGKCAV